MATAMTAHSSRALAGNEGSTWSLGGGIGLGRYSLGAVATAYPYGVSFLAIGPSLSPAGDLFLERRVNESWALVANVMATYDEARENGAIRSLSTGLGVSAGARWILNPGGTVEVSPVATFDGRWSRADARDPSWRTRVTSYSANLVLGLVLERELTDSLFLRLESPIVEAGYRWGDMASSWDGVVDRSEIAGYGATLALAPSIQLRMVF
jgi:hypothetical protein